MSSGTLIGFADEMRVGLRGMVRRVWGVRGVKVVQRLQLVYEWKYSLHHHTHNSSPTVLLGQAPSSTLYIQAA